MFLKTYKTRVSYYCDADEDNQTRLLKPKFENIDKYFERNKNTRNFFSIIKAVSLETALKYLSPPTLVLSLVIENRNFLSS